MPNTESVTPKKICDRPGCTVELSDRNASGRCRGHVRWQDRTSSAGNGHAAAPVNGVTAKTNGHSAVDALPAFSSERLDQFIASLTPPTKTKIVTMWLRGEL